MFITFEGIDLSGKSTQVARLASWFMAQELPVLLVREPGGTTLSETIRHLLLNAPHDAIDSATELLLFGAARSQLVAEVLQPAVRAGTHIIADRFHDSTTAYQGYGRGLPLADIRAVHAIALHGLCPDLTFFIDVDWEECERRRRVRGIPADRIERSDHSFFDRVRDGYLALAAEDPGRIVHIDGRSSIDDIAALVTRIVRGRLAS